MSMDAASDQEQEEDAAEEVMEAEIVSLTLDPPPATAATVLHQHHLHHGHHHGPNQTGPNIPQHNHPQNEHHQATNADDNVDINEDINEESVLENGDLEIDDIQSQSDDQNDDVMDDSKNRPSSIVLQLPSSQTTQGEENTPSPVSQSPTTPDISNAAPNLLKTEVLPKKSSFSCLKARKSESESCDQSERKTKRNVTFPEDGNMVTLKVEPVDPWKDVKPASSAEVISAYKKTCKQMKTKAIDNVIKQLQDLPDLTCRIATLSLKGVKLDNRSCEALEAIFRRVRFEVIDFENCGLEEEGATALLEMIEFYQSACRLNVALNPKMGMRGWQTLCRMLRKTPCLYSLDARRTMLTDQTMPMFGRCLKADPYLRTLHLEGVFLSGRPLLILTTALKYNTLLEELYLGDNDLQPADGVSIGAMLSANKTLQLLDLRNNGFRDGGLVHIANGLTDQANNDTGGLGSIVLWNLGLTHEAMFGFCDALAKSKTLRSLNLGQNRLGDLGIQKIKPGLIRNRSLRKLGLLNTRLGNEGAVALAEILADSISLTRIDVRENHIHIAGLMAVSLALKVNHSLIRIDLDKELRREPGLETVQQSVLADIYNFCHRNKQLARESISRENSTSEDNEPLISHDFSEDERSDASIDGADDFARNPEILSSLQSLASKESQKEVQQQQRSELSTPMNAYKSSASGQHKNSVIPKPRFTITKIMETIGHASADVANKIASVRMDSANRSPPKLPLSAKSAQTNAMEAPWKGLQRQPNVETSPKKTGDLPSPVRSRNSELKEFYRKLKDGEMDSTKNNLNENSNVANDNRLDNHIEKMQFPGKAKKLNDVIDDIPTEKEASPVNEAETVALETTSSDLSESSLSNGPVDGE
eukprot:Seg630.7 transcript_id=Seg630.7/GoldUCD/mRNA.D3Y31 product="Protein phosphatase 1 regulatory subunit 37" protein_id=Seg630.7/GoldUCD/D3Y31